MKKLFSIALSTLLLASELVACGSSAATPGSGAPSTGKAVGVFLQQEGREDGTYKRTFITTGNALPCN